MKRAKPSKAPSLVRDTIWEAPVHGVYVDVDGRILLQNRAGHSPRRLLDDIMKFDSNFALAIGSTPLKTLSDYQDIGTSILNSLPGTQAEKQLLVWGAEAIGLIAGGVGLVLAALPLLGLVKEPNPWDDLYVRLQQDLRELTRKTLAASWLDSMQEIHQYVGHSVTAAAIAAKKISGKSVSDQLLSQADYWSSYAVATLAGDPLWKRVYDTELLAGGVYLPILDHQPEVVNGLVFDYRLALPAYLKAAAARLLVIDALEPQHTRWGTYADEIKGYVATLKAFELRIRGGLAKPLVAPFHQHNWQVTAASSGAYDLHTGATNIVNFHPSISFTDPIDLIAIGGKYPTTFQEFEAQCNYATELRFWRLYDQLGFFELWRIISDVESLAGPRPPRTPPSNRPFYELDRRAPGASRLGTLVAPKSEQGQKLKAAYFEQHEEKILHPLGLKLLRRTDG